MPHQEGPVPPDSFAYKDVVYRVGMPLVWRLLDHVWRSPHRRASVDSLASAVWQAQDHDVSYLAVASLRRNANRFFRKHDIPFQMRLKDETVALHDSRTSKDSFHA